MNQAVPTMNQALPSADQAAPMTDQAAPTMNQALPTQPVHNAPIPKRTLSQDIQSQPQSTISPSPNQDLPAQSAQNTPSPKHTLPEGIRSQLQSLLGPSFGQSPPHQQTMAMPDRKQWYYRDPQGRTQGPWWGREMQDWYEAGYFTPELLVKKEEDVYFEPLGQLVRRIRNAREPFLH